MDDGMLDIDQMIADEWTAKPPIAFRFHGQIFKAHGDGPGLVLLNFVSAVQSNNGMAATTAMRDFLQACMPADEFARFGAVCDDPDTVTPVEHLALIVKGLMAAYDDRPTVPSVSSSDGSTPTDGGSPGGLRAVADASNV